MCYGADIDIGRVGARCLKIPYVPSAWRLFGTSSDASGVVLVDELPAVFGETAAVYDAATTIPFDVVANAFYFLASWSERVGGTTTGGRQLHANSAFARLRLPQDIVDRYLDRILTALDACCDRCPERRFDRASWPGRTHFAIVLSHDVDFIPAGLYDTLRQGAKTLVRHTVRQRSPRDGLAAFVGLACALATGRDAYGCVPEIIARERAEGVRSSFQVAVGHRHPDDVNYHIDDDATRDYLRAISSAGFDLCLHGSYRSTEQIEWYLEEVALLSRRLGRPLGSRQHFLSFDYDNLFRAQERAAIQYDMSLGYPDRTGPRNGFSYPFFPYCLDEDRPYDVIEINLVLMDVTLQSYMALKGAAAREAIDAQLTDLMRKRGCASVVWHPIVFGGARDPGYDELYWELVQRTRELGGLATDGRTINAFWRERAARYASFAPTGRR
jgi:hypothetical protein